MVLYGHTPVPVPEWVNNTLCLDTGCVFGGRLTALRYPEREIVSVPAAEVYYQPARPFPAPEDAAAGSTRREPDVLDITDVLGTRVVETAYHGRVAVRAENAAAALEVMSRFAIDPRWLVYLPPTMSPVQTSVAARPARAPGAGVRGLPPRRRGSGGLRGEAHGLAGRRADLLVGAGRGRPVRHRRRPAGRRVDQDGTAVPRPGAGRGAGGPAGRRRARGRACSPNSARPGCCWTPS